MNNLFCLIIVFLAVSAKAQWQLQLEAGALWQNRNDFRIPNTSSADQLQLDSLKEGPFLHYRAEVYYRVAKNHGLRAVYDPLTVKASGRLAEPLRFQGATFASGQATDIRYTFNSYRLTYFYAFWGHNDDQLNLGFTGKIRQAAISVGQGGLSREFDNLGFVPLLFFEYQKALSSNWFFHFNVDGLAGGPGRAIDAALKVRRRFGEDSFVSLGYRTIEGGADNDEVFTFSWLNYAVVDLGLNF